MRKENLGGKVVELYDSIEDMPVVNFQKYNKYLLFDSGIGSDLDSVDQHILRIAGYINAGKGKEAIQELRNMRQNIAMVSSSLSPRNMAFAATIKSIDGKELTDLSDENVVRVLEDLGRVKQSVISRILSEIKKKVSLELELYFPQDFVNSDKKEIYGILKRRACCILDGVMEGKNNLSEIEDIDSSLLCFHAPNCFEGTESAEIKYTKQFESACLLIAQESSLNPKGMTALQFYSALENIRKQAEAKQKAYKRK